MNSDSAYLRERTYLQAESWYWSADTTRNLHDIAQLIARDNPQLMGSRRSYELVFRAYQGQPRA